MQASKSVNYGRLATQILRKDNNLDAGHVQFLGKTLLWVAVHGTKRSQSTDFGFSLPKHWYTGDLVQTDPGHQIQMQKEMCG